MTTIRSISVALLGNILEMLGVPYRSYASFLATTVRLY
jgi:hypothetical protein